MSRQTGVRKLYSDDTLRHAVGMVRSGSMTLGQAASAFHIPKSSLSYKVNEKTSIGCRTGPSTVLTATEEDYLAKWVVHMAKVGFGRTRNELLDAVKKILDADGRPNPFKDNRPGKDWFYAFLKRHPEVSQRAPQQLAKERAVITPVKVQNWFKEFTDFMADEIDDPTLWHDPSRWFNADESGFPLCPKSGKVLAPKGIPNVYNFTSSDKTQITVLACMNAAGYFLKPLIVYPGKRFASNPLDGFESAVMGRTDTGWMDSELFLTWLKDVFSPGLDERSIKRPVVLFVDGHSTHSTLEASTFCRENNIVLYCLLAHASHLMQPCDLKLFSSLKESWKQSVRNYQISNVGEYVTKGRFASVFKPAWEKSTTLEISIKAFRDSGLFPLNPRKVIETLKMEPSTIFASTAASSNQTLSKLTKATAFCTVTATATNAAAATATTSSAATAIATSVATVTTIDVVTAVTTAPISSTTIKAASTTTTDAFSTKSIVAASSTTVAVTSSETGSTAHTSSAVCTTTALVETGQANEITQPANESVLIPASVETPSILQDITNTDSFMCSSTVNSSTETQQCVPGIFKDILQLPVAKAVGLKSSSRKGREQLPKAISGKRFHEMMEERKRKKEEEVRKKEERKQKRQELKQKRIEETERKQKLREDKLRQREEKRKEKELQKKIRLIEKMKNSKKTHIDTDSNSSASEPEYADDDLDDVLEPTDNRACYACEAPFDGQTDNWISCHNCPRWLHRACVKTIDLLSLNEADIADLGFECDYC